MTGNELLDRASSRELTEYMLLEEIRQQEAHLRDDGFTPEEIADAIEGGSDADAERHRRRDPDAGPGLLDQLLGDDVAAERQRRLMEVEDLDEDEDHDGE